MIRVREEANGGLSRGGLEKREVWRLENRRGKK